MQASLFLAVSLTASPLAVPWALPVLKDHCFTTAADPRNPWALAHGITALGADYAARDGRAARTVIVHDFLERNLLPDGGVGPGSPLGFRPYGKDGTPIEPHPNLLTKTLVLAGVKPQASFETGFGKVTLAQLVDSVKLGFHHAPENEEYWHHVGWTLDLLTHQLKPGESFTTGAGEKVAVDSMMDDALAYLERATADLSQGMKQGLPVVPKRKQGLYAHSCGGLHLVQAVFTYARFPQVKKRWGQRLDAQLAVLFYRLDSEHTQYQQAYELAVAKAPELKLTVLVQELKFYGHFLETLGRFKDETGWKPNAAQAQGIAKAKAYLDYTTRRIEELKAFDGIDTLMSTQRQVALDLIGDSCHAAHGLEAWK